MKTYVSCIWVDLDGTLCNNAQRQHLIAENNWDAVFESAGSDLPHKPIVELVQVLARHYFIMICTGRPERNRTISEQWLLEHGVPYDKMYMRRDDDERPDTHVKLEMLMQLRKEGYEPLFCLEDRNKVVKILREAGLKVLHVQDGDF